MMTPRQRAGFETQVVWTHTPWGGVRHLKVWRSNGKDGITWDQLQDLKDECLGPDTCAIEFYPPQFDLVKRSQDATPLGSSVLDPRAPNASRRLQELLGAVQAYEYARDSFVPCRGRQGS